MQPLPERIEEWKGFDAELYSLTTDKGQKADLPRAYKELAERTGGPVLELMCGQGRRALQLARAGYKVTAVDQSEDMLRFAREKAAVRGKEVAERVQFVCGDVRKLRLQQQFALIICDDWSFAYMTSQEDQIRFLETVRAHLSAEGIALIIVFTPHFKLTRDGALEKRTHSRTHHISEREWRVVFTASHEFDPLSQVETVWQRYVVEAPNEPTRRYEYPYYFRHTYRWELELLIRHAGLHAVTRWSDVWEDRLLDDQPPLDNVENDFVYLVKRG